MLSPAPSLVDDLVSRLRHVYGSRFVALYLCDEPIYADDDEAADYDFVLVLRGDFRPAAEILAMSYEVSDVCLDYSCLITVEPIAADEVATPRSLAMVHALQHSARVA
jgi:hypothetical protein